MKRLTTDRTKIFARESVTLNSINKSELRKLYNEVFDRLQVYEVAEEAGTLVRLPCKVGDDLYFIHKESNLINLVEHLKVRTFFSDIHLLEEVCRI